MSDRSTQYQVAAIFIALLVAALVIGGVGWAVVKWVWGMIGG
jgi:hypothetical protein